MLYETTRAILIIFLATVNLTSMCYCAIHYMHTVVLIGGSAIAEAVGRDLTIRIS